MLLTDQSEISKNSRQCPDCNSDQIGRVSRSGGADRIRSLINRYPYQCYQCPTMNIFYLIGKK
jgi:uncharacterized protein with PIN domain